MSLVLSSGFNGVTDPDAARYIEEIENADGQLLEFAVGKAINDFVLGCKADGIWDAIKASCILAGARTLAGALVPLAGTAPTSLGTAAGWVYDRKLGLKGNGTDNYLNTNRANTADPQNSNHNAIYISNVEGDTFGLICAGSTTAANNIFKSGNYFYRSRSSNAYTLPFNTSTGFMAINRASSAAYSVDAGGTIYTVTEASLTPVTADVLIFSRAGAFFTTSRIAFYSVGEAVNTAFLRARVTTLINAFSTAIP